MASQFFDLHSHVGNEPLGQSLDSPPPCPGKTVPSFHIMSFSGTKRAVCKQRQEQSVAAFTIDLRPCHVATKQKPTTSVLPDLRFVWRNEKWVGQHGMAGFALDTQGPKPIKSESEMGSFVRGLLPHNGRGRSSHTHQKQTSKWSLHMNEQYAQMIPTFPLFKGFTLQGAQMLLGYGEVKEYSQGEVLLKEGDKPTFVLVVLTGRMQIFIEREGRELMLNEAGPGTILGELAVLACIPRSSSVRASEKSAVLHWSAGAFRDLLLRDPFLSERIFRESLRTLIGKEKSLIDTLIRSPNSPPEK